MTVLLKIFLICSVLAGFVLSIYLLRKKGSDQVLGSKYSRFFGIPVALLGLLYYGFALIAYAIIVKIPFFVSQPILFFVVSVSVVALLFSLYLTFIQFFNLKHWCAWCVASTVLCAMIVYTALSTIQVDIMGVLVEYYDMVFMTHVIAYAVALGVATILDIFFFKFLKDFQISDWEADVLHTISEVLWFAFGFVVLTAVALYFPENEFQNQSPTFLAHLSLQTKSDNQNSQLHHLRKWGYGLASLSFVTWYFSFFLAFVQLSGVSISSILLLYAGIGLVAVLASQFINHSFGRS